MNVFDVSLCYNKTNYSYSSLWEAKEMKNSRSGNGGVLVSLACVLKLNWQPARVGGGNKVISSALESPFSDAKVSEDGLLTCKEEHEEESTMARQLPWNRYEVALLWMRIYRYRRNHRRKKRFLPIFQKIYGKEPCIWDIRSMRPSEMRMVWASSIRGWSF